MQLENDTYSSQVLGRVRFFIHLQALSLQSVIQFGLDLLTSEQKKILRRDHFRCRGCDRSGDGIEILVYPIYPGALHPHHMLTLCVNCVYVVELQGFLAASVPEFLRYLWSAAKPLNSEPKHEEQRLSSELQLGHQLN